MIIYKIKDYQLFIRVIHKLIENNKCKTIEDVKNIKELKDFCFYDYKMDIKSFYTNYTVAYNDLNKCRNAYMIITKGKNCKIIYKDGNKINLKKFHSYNKDINHDYTRIY